VGLIAEIAFSLGIDVRYSGSTELVGASDIVRCLEALRGRNVRILGLEGFRISGSHVVPEMNAIADFSVMNDRGTALSSVDEAVRFVSEFGDPDLFYEVILPEDVA
jgi:hypothetical protein